MQLFVALFLAIAAPFAGYFITRMPNIDTGKKMPVRDSVYYGVGCALGTLGLLSFVASAIIWLWSISTQTPATVIDLSFGFGYAVVIMAIGGIIMGLTYPHRN